MHAPPEIDRQRFYTVTFWFAVEDLRRESSSAGRDHRIARMLRPLVPPRNHLINTKKYAVEVMLHHLRCPTCRTIVSAATRILFP